MPAPLVHRASAAALAMFLLAVATLLGRGSAEAAFPGTNGVIAFARQDARQSDVWVVNADGTGARNLTNTRGANERDPAISPDGLRVAYVRGSEIFVAGIDGSEPRQVTRDRGFKSGVNWSPDGAVIVYNREPAGRDSRRMAELYVAPAGGGEPVRLTNNGSYDGDAAFMPDGRIVFDRRLRNRSHELHVMNPDGSGIQRLTTTTGRDSVHADVAPDGSRIVFLRCCPTRTRRFEGRLFTIAPDGTGEAPLTSGARPDGIPAWSPDGSRLVFERRAPRGTRTQLFTMAPDGSEFRRLVTSRASDGQPSWGPAPAAPRAAPAHHEPRPRPAPRRPPRPRSVRLLATGDSNIQIVDSQLARRLEPRKRPRVSVRSDAHISTGISKPFMLDWVRYAGSQVRRHHQQLTVMFIGANDGFPIGGADCCDGAWIDGYARRVRAMMETYARNGAGRVYWLTLPTPRRADFRRIYRAVNVAIGRAAQGFDRGQVRVIDLVRVFTPGGRYRSAMRVNGRTRTVRQSDGVHLNGTGAAVAAGLVVRTMRRDGLV